MNKKIRAKYEYKLYDEENTNFKVFIAVILLIIYCLFYLVII